MDAEAGTRHSETLRTDIRPKNPTPQGVGDVNNGLETNVTAVDPKEKIAVTWGGLKK